MGGVGQPPRKFTTNSNSAENENLTIPDGDKEISQRTSYNIRKRAPSLVIFPNKSNEWVPLKTQYVFLISQFSHRRENERAPRNNN